MEKLLKKLREIIKKLKIKKKNLTRPVKKFRKFFKGLIDLGQDHALF